MDLKDAMAVLEDDLGMDHMTAGRAALRLPADGMNYVQLSMAVSARRTAVALEKISAALEQIAKPPPPSNYDWTRPPQGNSFGGKVKPSQRPGQEV